MGVVRIGDLEDNTFNSRKIVLNSTTFSLFRVTIDMYAIEMTDEDEFCLEISRDSGLTWTTQSCIDEHIDFECGVWYSPDIEFKADIGEDTLMIRFRNTGKEFVAILFASFIATPYLTSIVYEYPVGDVLLNKVDVLGWDVFATGLEALA